MSLLGRGLDASVRSMVPVDYRFGMRQLDLKGSPSDIGREHGHVLASDIERYVTERLRLAGDGSWSGRRSGRDEILDVGGLTIEAHRRFSPDLFEEVEAMAEASGHSVAEMLVLGGFTDIVDVLRNPVGEDDCTAMLVPNSHADAAYLAQTWDMHDTARPFIALLRIDPDRGPASIVFTTAGCVGQMGLNEAGIGVGINNLTADQGVMGVTWPFVVRKALAQTSLDAALDIVANAPVAGGHNFLLMGPDGRGFNVEAMPGKSAVDELGARPIVHTNHCVHASTKALEAARPGSLTESSVARLERGQDLTRAGSLDVGKIWSILSDPAAICRRSEPPHHVESCGAIVLRPATREMWASDGIPVETTPERFAFE